MTENLPRPGSSGDVPPVPAPSAYRARLRTVRDPSTPVGVGMRLVGALFWRDLVEVSRDPRLHPPLRRRAEGLLAERASDLTEGELVALARVADRPVISALAGCGRARVVAALLGNPRVREDDVLAMCRTAGGSDVLSSVAACHRWRASRAVRLALARNPATPAPDALRALEGLQGPDLHALASDDRVPTLVRVGAARRAGRAPLPRTGGDRI